MHLIAGYLERVQGFIYAKKKGTSKKNARPIDEHFNLNLISD